MLKNYEKFNTWLPALFDGQFHWDFLKPAFKDTKIMPMDFDAVVERYGKFLIFETKSKGKQIDLGQKITLQISGRKTIPLLFFWKVKILKILQVIAFIMTIKKIKMSVILKL